VGYCVTFPASNAATTVASASFLLWEYAGAYRRTQLFTSGEGRGLRIFLGALDWLGQREFRRKVRVLPRRRPTQGQSKR
jgi:hypothetical protein